MRQILLVLMLFFSQISICVADISIIENHNDAVSLSKNSGMPLLLIFGGENCPHCNSLKKDIINGRFDDNLDKFIVCYLETINNKDLAKTYGVGSIPDSRIIKDKKEISKKIGYDRTQYKKWLNNAK